jgi:hypothetical protein
MSQPQGVINVPISILTGINNGQSSAIRGMPQKDSTSDGTNSFALNRSLYTNTLPTTTPTVQQQIKKKWFGNRDASQVTRNRRVNEIGVGSLNAANQTMDFMSHSNQNTVNDALTRVRAGGAVAPPKKDAKRNNAPTPGFPTGILVRTQYRTVVPISNQTAMASKPISANIPRLYH